MKILVILHLPWNPNLGAPRCFIELASEFRKLGHQVDKFDIDDALPNCGKLKSYFQQYLFCKKAEAYVRQRGLDYDIVIASQISLTRSKPELGFNGILVSRSDGLVHFFRDDARRMAENERKHGVRRGKWAGNMLRWVSRRLFDEVDAANASFRNSDFITVPNKAEFEFVQNKLGYGKKVLLAPNGLSADRLVALGATAPPNERQRGNRIAFIGYWIERKGSFDLPAIVRWLRAGNPALRIQLLGTVRPADGIRKCFDLADRDALEIVPSFKSEELPSLLARATVGVLPSYVEGFGLAILEMLAAGIPTVAYDIPGPKDMLAQFSPPLLCPVGDHRELARMIEKILSASNDEYAALSERSRKIASQYRWDTVARRLIDVWQAESDKRLKHG